MVDINALYMPGTRYQNVLCQSEILIISSASSKTFVPAQKQNLLNGNHLLVWHKMFGTGTKCMYIFGLAQNILERVEGQGIRNRTKRGLVQNK
jgi:hypothetical protein